MGHSSAVMVPKSPCDSSSGPAAKKSVLVGPAPAPLPNAIAHNPSISTGRWSGRRSVPRSPPVARSKALMRPLPKLPTSRSPEKRPKPAGAMAMPQGAFNNPRLTTRAMNAPCVSKTLTRPRPGPCTSSIAFSSCLAYET
jgi:hypothetical protein